MNIYNNTNAFVYVWTNQLTGKKYIGVHKGTADDRYICSSKIMKEEYDKNPEFFSRQIVCFGDYESMLIIETEMLKSVDAKYNSNYYNMHNGDGNFYKKKCSYQEIKKMSERMKGKPAKNKGKPMTEEQKQKLRKPKSEEHKQKLRKPKSEEQKQKMRKPKSEEHKQKLREANLGKKHSEESKQKISEATRGENNPMWGKIREPVWLGKKHSDESKQKMRDTKFKKKQEKN
jgi:hypothetical protein